MDNSFLVQQMRGVYCKILFDDNSIKELIKSDTISTMTSKSITYSKEFKVAIAKCKSIIQVKDAFKLSAINIELVSEKCIVQFWYLWRRQLYKVVVQH